VWQQSSMHYNLPGGRLVKSENAAKPAPQPSRFLIEMIGKLPLVNNSVDYGCGKLRYSEVLLQTTELLAVVDSEIQVSRQQVLRGTFGSIRDFFHGSNRVSVFSTTEFDDSHGSYDRAFCLNVLSAIPLLEVRQRVLDQILRKLKPGACCLFVVQYRNSDFTRMSKLPTAEPWQDGFLINSLRGYSFYALISPRALAEMVETAGFAVVSQHLNEGSVYLWAGRTGV
jgi:SAM-dependent methyltransferase